MNPLFISALVVLAVVSTASYYLGTKKNRWIVSTMSRQLEEALKPKTTNYVNIGGVIGYNFTYSLPAPYTSAKGTITLSPRHSLLYLPVSRLLGIGDRFFVNIFTKKKFKGEAHIVDLKYLGKANIAGVETMERRDVEAKGKKFVLMWRKADLATTLESTLAALDDPASLRHFCAYNETGTFFIHLRPKAGQLAETVQTLVKKFPEYLESGKEQ
jgi:hypothetical protein